ncbi:MAG: NAD(+) diphosphatase [Porcipelethomonas sp.]
MHYKYCPQCGTKLSDKIAGDDGFIPFCEKCEKYWFDTFASCVIVLVANEFNEIALLNQNYISEKHANFVSGYIVPGENAEETAIREVKEEIGITLEKLEYAGTYWFEKKDMLMHGFIGYAKKTDFILSSEVDSAEWVKALKAPEKMFPDRPGNVMHPLYRKYLNEIKVY